VTFIYDGTYRARNKSHSHNSYYEYGIIFSSMPFGNCRLKHELPDGTAENRKHG
jgi:hypothetical protein